MKKIYTALRLMLLIPALMLSSCIKEDNSNCPVQANKVRVIIRTIAEETRAETTLGQIDNVLIYIFDEHERFVGTWQGDAYIYGQRYVAELDIEPGTYHFVVWTNQGDSYDKTIPTYSPDDPADDLVVSMKYPSDGKITDDITDLHYGLLTDANVVRGKDNEFLVVLKPNTYKLNFTVEGLPATGDDYTFTVNDCYLLFGVDNSFVEQTENKVDYIRTATFDGDYYCASMNMLKICEGRNPSFDFTDITTGDDLYSDELVDMIKKAYRKNGHIVDFDTEYEFDIKISFNGSLGVNISVNGWSYNPNEGILE